MDDHVGEVAFGSVVFPKRNGHAVHRFRHAFHLVSRSQIDIRIPFASLGLDSAAAVGISGDLEVWIGRRISPTVLYSYPTIESLASYLAEGTGDLAVRFEDGTTLQTFTDSSGYESCDIHLDPVHQLVVLGGGGVAEF